MSYTTEDAWCDRCGPTVPRTLVQAEQFPLHFPGAYDRYRCDGCGVQFFSPRQRADLCCEATDSPAMRVQSELLHRTGHWAEPETPPEHTIAETQEAVTGLIRLARRHAAASVSFLDVGCHVGRAMRAAKSAGFTDVAGIDPCPTHRPYASQWGAFVCGPFLTLEPRPFDVVFMNDVIEHTFTPWRDLLHARAFVAPGGVMYLKTFADDMVGAEVYRVIGHEHYFTRAQLREWLAAAGWTIVDSGEQPTCAQVWFVCRPVAKPEDRGTEVKMVEAIPSYAEYLAASQHSYTIAAPPQAIAAWSYGETAALLLPDHLDLVQRILAAKTLKAASRIPTDAPYHQTYYQGALKDWSWPRLLEHRARVVFGIKKARAIDEPLEVFCGAGGILHFHGHHRLAAAVALGLPTVPVTFYACDTAVGALAEYVFGIYSGALRHSLYQPIDHPFFAPLPVHDCNAAWPEKWGRVLDVARDWRGRVVEAGAHFGMLTRHLRAGGIDCHATDLMPEYRRAQPMFEAIGLDAVPYETIAVQGLAARQERCCLVSTGLFHHLMGKADLAESVLPGVLEWMRSCVPEAVVEVSTLAEYLGGPAAVVTPSNEAAAAFWREAGFEAECIYEGALKRHLFHLRRAA